MKPFIHETADVNGCTMEPDSKINMYCNVRDSKLAAGASVGDFSCVCDSFLDEGAELRCNAQANSVEMGRHSYTGKNFTGWHCKIGAYCSISWNVSIGGAEHDYRRTTMHSFLYTPNYGITDDTVQPFYDRFAKDCVIGNDVWIAAGAIVRRGVHIGDGAVVGAGAIVTKDVEPYTIVVGNPAKPLKKRFSDDIIELLLQSRWWEFPDEVVRENLPLFAAEADIATAERLIHIRRKLEAAGVLND